MAKQKACKKASKRGNGEYKEMRTMMNKARRIAKNARREDSTLEERRARDWEIVTRQLATVGVILDK